LTGADISFESGRLRLARELRGWNQAELAVRVDLSAAAVSQFESGATAPGPGTIGRLASALEVPDGFFGLPLVETHDGFFRSLRRTSLRQRRQARAIAFVAHDAVSAPQSSTDGAFAADIPLIPIDDLDADRDRIEEIAGAVREKWQLPDGPIADMVALLEAHDAVVIRLPMGTDDVDAFSLPFPDRPVVVLASDKGDLARSRFDAAHELGHLVMHRDQVWGVKEVEQHAHWFAAAFLMPKGDIIEELPERAEWPVLFDLKRKWQVSLAALLMRAKTLGRMSPATYLGAVKETSARGWRRVEPIPLGDCEQPSYAPLNANESLTDTLPRDILGDLEFTT